MLMSGIAHAGAGEMENQKFASIIQPLVERNELAGAVTLIASPDRVLDREAFGYADVAARRPMSPDDMFWIASQSKPMTAAALMMLVDEGKINVDDPVEKYLPEFQGEMVNDHGKLRQPTYLVTIRNLLTHTSGLPFAAPEERPTLDLLPLSTRAADYARLPLQFEPGSKFSYANAGLNTVGRIIEVVSGLPYEKFLQERLLDPLGMTNTTFWPNEEQIARLAKSYKPNADKTGLIEIHVDQLNYPLTNPKRYPVPAGGLFSTADDICKFYQMLINGGSFAGKRILSERAVKEMTSKQTGKLDTGYGYGLFTDGNRVGHSGAYHTDTIMDRKHQLIMIFLVQHADWAPECNNIVPAFQKAAISLWGNK
jgi:CubicO group peptidase (beta-lactamase class C family)